MANPVSGILKTITGMFSKGEKAGEELVKTGERVEPKLEKIDNTTETAAHAAKKEKSPVTPEDVADYLKHVKENPNGIHATTKTEHAATAPQTATHSNTVEQTGRWEKAKDGFKDGASATGSFVGKWLKRGAILVGVSLGLNSVLPEDNKVGQLSGEVVDKSVGFVKGTVNSAEDVLKSGRNKTANMEASSDAKLADAESRQVGARNKYCATAEGGRYGTVTKECISVDFGEDYQGLTEAFEEIPSKEADLRYMKEMGRAIVALNETGNLSSDTLAEKRTKIMEEIKGNFTGKDSADFDVVDRKIAQKMGWGYSDRAP